MKNIFKKIWDFFKSISLILGLIFLLVVGIALVIIIFKGKIYIEVIIIFILIYMILFWKIWFHHSQKKLIKDYKPEEDLGRLAEEESKSDNGKNKTTGGNRRVERKEPAIRIPNTSDVGLKQPQGRELLPKTNVGSVRENRSGIRKILRRRSSP